jgi:hypothetical protein
VLVGNDLGLGVCAAHWAGAIKNGQRVGSLRTLLAPGAQGRSSGKPWGRREGEGRGPVGGIPELLPCSRSCPATPAPEDLRFCPPPRSSPRARLAPAGPAAGARRAAVGLGRRARAGGLRLRGVHPLGGRRRSLPRAPASQILQQAARTFVITSVHPARQAAHCAPLWPCGCRRLSLLPALCALHPSARPRVHPPRRSAWHGCPATLCC